jgi:hypothetical protein
MLKNFSRTVEINNNLKQLEVEFEHYNVYKYATADIVFKDMMFFTQT